jgi:hypothetical protein
VIVNNSTYSNRTNNHKINHDRCDEGKPD